MFAEPVEGLERRRFAHVSLTELHIACLHAQARFRYRDRNPRWKKNLGDVVDFPTWMSPILQIRNSFEKIFTVQNTVFVNDGRLSQKSLEVLQSNEYWEMQSNEYWETEYWKTESRLFVDAVPLFQLLPPLESRLRPFESRVRPNQYAWRFIRDSKRVVHVLPTVVFSSRFRAFRLNLNRDREHASVQCSIFGMDEMRCIIEFHYSESNDRLYFERESWWRRYHGKKMLLNTSWQSIIPPGIIQMFRGLQDFETDNNKFSFTEPMDLRTLLEALLPGKVPTLPGHEMEVVRARLRRLWSKLKALGLADVDDDQSAALEEQMDDQ